jgi:hypothetical protein
MIMKKLLIPLFLLLVGIHASYAKKAVPNLEYGNVIAKTASMVGDQTSQALSAKHGLQILNVTWEDTGRYKGSSVGPNISDMTIQVQRQNDKTGQYELTCMPVIRYPNFEDISADIRPSQFYLLVGNEKGKPLKKISLSEYLKNIRKYMSTPASWKGNGKSFLAKRDTHVLVSAQACFLPIPKKGIAEFNPVLFNYQSYKGDPAVLTILATREGTSMTIIDNTRDAFEAGATWGQRLFFNTKGKRASLTGKRLSEFIAEKNGKNQDGKPLSVEAAKKSGLNLVLLIQVPLKQKQPMRFTSGAEMDDSASELKAAPSAAKRSDVENAVIGHGKVEGPFTEVDDLEIERDENFPIRVTVQFYKATSNGVVSENDMKEIAAQIKKVYKNADYTGSLVTQGETKRPTEYNGPKFQPPDWWDQFWKRHQNNTGMTPEETIIMLRKLYGPNWKPRDEKEFEKEVRKLEEKNRK